MSFTTEGSCQQTILIAADDLRGASRVRAVLDKFGFHIVLVNDLKTHPVDIDPSSICAAIYVTSSSKLAADELQVLRRHVWGSPILAVLHGALPEDRVASLEAGADDCVDEDCRDIELVARLRAHDRLRKRLTIIPIAPGSLLLDTQARRLERLNCEPKRACDLSAEIFLLCRALALTSNTTVSHSELKRAIWNGDVSDSTLHRLVYRANRRLARLGGITIRNEHGVGYRFHWDA